MAKRADDPPRDPDGVVVRAVPVSVRIAGAWSWRIVCVLLLVAVLVVPVHVGPVQALIAVAVAVGVNQLESHVLQPLLMGGAVRLHPVAVVLTVATGSLLGGIAAAVFAVPLVAAENSAVQFVARGAWKDDPAAPAGPLPEVPPTPRARRLRRVKPEPQDVTTIG